MPTRVFRIAVVSGEASGDLLGAALIAQLHNLGVAMQVRAVGGAHLAECADVELIADNEVFAVMGLAEVVKHLPRLLRERKRVTQKLLDWRPHVFIGVDAPDLNFGIEKIMRRHGVPVVHYVSPSVWAWRPGRVLKMARHIDLMLTLFPFEPAIYQGHIEARFVGHPSALSLPRGADKQTARKRLQLPDDAPIVALLPGSRGSEIKHMTPVFAQALRQMQAQRGGDALILTRNVSAEKTRRVIDLAAAQGLKVQPCSGDAQALLQAADVALLASGTVALEAMLCGTPMVVAHRISRITWAIIKTFKMMQLPYYSLPNVLHGGFLVPELMQQRMTAKNICAALLPLFDPRRREALQGEFDRLHESILPPTENAAGQAVLDFMEARC